MNLAKYTLCNAIRMYKILVHKMLAETAVQASLAVTTVPLCIYTIKIKYWYTQTNA